MRRMILIASLGALFPNLLYGQMEAEASFRKAEESLMTQLSVYPQEKVHLHTDRDLYVPGEKIWFKAYVTDAATHQYPTLSRYVYAELIDARDSLVGRTMIRPDGDGLFHGHLFLSELIPEGNYTLRAYTRHMENLGDDYFFKKNIRIGNLPSAAGQSSKAGRIGGVEKGTDDFEVSFFPEGGNLPAGVLCRVAFKALNRKGYPEMISGSVEDENETKIASVRTLHAGMGAFSYMPVPGKRYYLKCSNADGLKKQFELPAADPYAYTLTASWRSGKLLVGVQKASQSPEIPCYLLVHCRGLALYFSAWDGKKEVVTFAEEQFPAGVIQFVLFDRQMNPLSERLVFSKHGEGTKVAFQTDKEAYETRENILASLSVADSDGNPLAGHLSVAVTDDKDLSIDASTTILSSLLLTSELKGYIENPAYYLQEDIQATTASNYLMMTHGWRRYDVPEVLKGNPAYPRIPFQASQEISGKATSLLLARPVANSVISILADGEFGSVITDEKGGFTFRDFEYPDSTSYFIQALSERGNSWIALDVDMDSYPVLVHAPQSPAVKEDKKEEPVETAFIAKAGQRSQYDEDMRVIHLNEVMVTASRFQRKRDEPRLRYWQNQNADITIRKEEFESSPPIFVADLIRKVPGAWVSSEGYVRIKPPGLSPTLPLVFIDGILYEWPKRMVSPQESPLETIPVGQIESIDIVKGGGSALFGMRGEGGVISITTRRGADAREKFNYALYTPLGYQKPAEFYAPRYETPAAKHLSNPDYRTTIHWKPDVLLSGTGEASFDFYASDFPTTYSVVLEGLTSDGRIIRQIEKIRVK